MRTRGKMLAAMGVAAGVAAAVTPSAAVAKPMPEAGEAVVAATVREKIAQWATQELYDRNHNREVPAGSNCNFYAGVFGTGTRCGSHNGQPFRSEAWCADFAKYTWKNGGANVQGLDARTESFKEYGRRHNTWVARPDLVGIQPGDVVLYDDSSSDPRLSSHVAVVVWAYYGDVLVVSGNVGIPGENNDGVYKHDAHYLSQPAVGYVRPVW